MARAAPELPLRAHGHEPGQLLPGCDRSDDDHGRAFPRRVRGGPAGHHRRHPAPGRRPDRARDPHPAGRPRLPASARQGDVQQRPGTEPQLPRSRLRPAGRRRVPLHQRALPERELRRLPAGPAEAGRLHPHHGCAPRLGPGHDRRPPGRERRHPGADRPRVDLPGGPLLRHPVRPRPLCQLRHLVPADERDRYRGQPVRAHGGPAVRGRPQVQAHLVQRLLRRRGLRSREGERGRPGPGQRPLRPDPGGRGPLARHRGRGQCQPDGRPRSDAGLRLQRCRGDEGQPGRHRRQPGGEGAHAGAQPSGLSLAGLHLPADLPARPADRRRCALCRLQLRRPAERAGERRLSPVRRRRPLRPRRPPRAPARRLAGPQRQQPARQGLHHLLLGLRLQLGRGPHRDRHLGLAVAKG